MQADEVQSGICPRSPCTNPWTGSISQAKTTVSAPVRISSAPRRHRRASAEARIAGTGGKRTQHLCIGTRDQMAVCSGRRRSQAKGCSPPPFAARTSGVGAPLPRPVSVAPQKCSAHEKAACPRRSLIVLPGLPEAPCRAACRPPCTDGPFASDGRHETIL